MDVLFSLAVFFLGPAVVVGGVVALIAKAAGKNASKAFWIAFLIVLGLEGVGIGLCVAAFSQIG